MQQIGRNGDMVKLSGVMYVDGKASIDEMYYEIKQDIIEEYESVGTVEVRTSFHKEAVDNGYRSWKVIELYDNGKMMAKFDGLTGEFEVHLALSSMCTEAIYEYLEKVAYDK